MKLNAILLAAGTALFLMADFLAFHDIREFHSVKDWMMLTGTLIYFVHAGRYFVDFRRNNS